MFLTHHSHIYHNDYSKTVVGLPMSHNSIFHQYQSLARDIRIIRKSIKGKKHVVKFLTDLKTLIKKRLNLEHTVPLKFSLFTQTLPFLGG